MILIAMGSSPTTGVKARSSRRLATYLSLALGFLGSVGLRADGDQPAVKPSVAVASIRLAKPMRRAGRRALLRPKRNPTDQDILDQAQAAYIRGERQHAIDLATSVAAKGGSLAEPAWRFIGLAACSVRAGRLATRAYGNLADSDDQQELIRACKINGLAFLANEFVER
jgi:hypothetical protein